MIPAGLGVAVGRDSSPGGDVSTYEGRLTVFTRTPARLLAAVREVLLLSGVFVLYEVGRHVVRNRASMAFRDADLVVSVERSLHLPSETGLQQLLLPHEAWIRAANVFYVSVHFPATVGFLIWMWVFQPAAYAWARSLLVSVTMVALVVHVSFPLAPPRLLPGRGFVDTMAVYGPSAYGEGTGSVTNQFAAMPSLHAAWAIVIGIVLVATLSGRWRWLAILHPLVTVAVVIATGNHYWLDVLAAVALVALALSVHGHVSRQRTPAATSTGRPVRTCPG